ncbi:MATE family efflux transporter [Clostridium oceanicum]|uniref:MATE family efflux transporter n=1 Tax=Clostridium oceanicum TaxID=1543 RepID=A0ABP3UTQ9_9CLOT
MKTDNLELMTKEKPIKLLLKLGIPSIIMSLFNEINAIIDTVFLGQFVADEAVSAMSLVFPFFILVSAIAFLFSDGSSIAIGRYLGAKNIEKANSTFGSTIYISIIISVILGIVGFVTFPHFLQIFNLDTRIMNYAKTYLTYLSLGIPIIVITIILGKIVYTEGFTNVLLKATFLQIVVNIILNYIALAILKVGILGTCIATVFSFLVQGIYLYRFMRLGKMVIGFKKSTLKVTKAYFKEVIPLGMATFITMTLLSLTLGLESKVISTFGSSALAVQTITGNLFSATGSIASGIMTASLVLMSYSVGAKDRERFLKILKISLVIIFTSTLILNLPLVLGSSMVVKLFTSSKDILKTFTVPALVYGISSPLIFTTNAILYAMQPINMEKTATVMFTLQQIVFFIPLLFILKPYGFNFAVSAQPISEIIGAVITIMLVPLFLKKVNAVFKINTTNQEM